MLTRICLMLIKPTKTFSSPQMLTKTQRLCVCAKTSVGGDSEKMTEKIKTEPGKSFLGRRRRRRLVATSVLPPLLDDQQDDTCSFPETRILQKKCKKEVCEKKISDVKFQKMFFRTVSSSCFGSYWLSLRSFCSRHILCQSF